MPTPDNALHSSRMAAAFLDHPASVQKLFGKLGARFGMRNGGYTRLGKPAGRKGDGIPPTH